MKYACLAACISATILSTLSAGAQNNTPLHAWEFDGEDNLEAFSRMREIQSVEADGVLQLNTTGSDPQLIIKPKVEGPVRLQFRMRSGDGAFGRMEIFWEGPDDNGFSENRAAMYPLQHDMEWHEYDFGLPIKEGPTEIRLDPGWKKGTFEIDTFKIMADSLSDAQKEAIKNLPATIAVSDDILSATFNSQENRLVVTDKRSGRDWFLDLSECQAYITGLKKVTDKAIRFDLYDLSTRAEYTSTMTIQPGGILHFDLITANPDTQFWALRNWPPRIQSNFDNGRIIFCDRSSGTLINQKDEYYGGRDLAVYGNTRCTDMPWVGMIEWESGDGVMTLAETPTDAIFSYINTGEKGLIWPQLRWMPSMDVFGYKREMSFRFSAGDRHVGLAQVYRKYAKEVGRLKTLREKAELAPHVDRLMGGAIIWGATDALEFITEARNLGITRATICNANHGLRDTNSLRTINQMGYLTLEYDSLSDIMDGPTGFQSDDVDKTAYHARPGLGPKGGWIMADGSRFSERSSAYALRALQTYVPPALEKYGFNARFVDVAMAINLQEDWHPEHTFDRRQDMAYKREAYEYLRSLDLVLGTEHGNDWGVDLVDFFEGSAGGPFHWKKQGDWSSGGLTRPTNRDDYREDYLKYGTGYDTSIPLWQLVYQDCTVSTWYWGDTPGFHYHVAPDIADRKDLFNILYGAVTLLWRDEIGYGWRENQERFLQSYHDTAHLHGAVAYSTMTDHQFLSQDMALQRTVFNDGTVVVVNFSDEPRVYTPSDAEPVSLAPRGYWAHGPEIRQERIIEDGNIIKRIETQDFRLYQSDLRRQFGPVSVEGKFTAFAMPENYWRMVLEPGRRYIIDVAEMTGWDPGTEVSLYETDRLAKTKRAVTIEQNGDTIDFVTPEGSRTFALQPVSVEPAVTIYPPAGEKKDNQSILLSTAVKGHDIRYTKDGTDPGPKSPIYYGPFALNESGQVRAQLYHGDRPVGPVSTMGYTVVREVYNSGRVLYQEHPRGVVADLRGANYLRLRVTDAGNGPWADLLNLTEPYLYRPDGSKVPLWEMEPIHTWFMHEEMTIGERDTGSPLVIKGTTFEHGIGFRAESEVIWKLDGEYEYLEGWTGIDDSAENPMRVVGSAELILDAMKELPE